MSKTVMLTAVIEREDDGFVALCPELDIASQGDTVDEARAMLIEALQGWFEVASHDEVERRLKTERDSLSPSSYPLGRLRRLTPEDMIRILELNGFARVRQRGSHVQMRGLGPQGIVTIPGPLHRGLLRIGTMSSIIRQSGLPRSLFEGEE